MFLTGWELDVSRLTRQARSLAATSTAAMVVPFGAGVLGASLLYARHSTADAGPVDPTAFLLYMGTAFAITAFPVLARLLADKGMHRTPTGSTALACAALADVLAWCLLVVVVFIAQSTGAGQLVGTLAGSAAFIAVCVFVVRPLSQRVIPAVADRFRVGARRPAWPDPPRAGSGRTVGARRRCSRVRCGHSLGCGGGSRPGRLGGVGAGRAGCPIRADRAETAGSVRRVAGGLGGLGRAD